MTRQSRLTTSLGLAPTIALWLGCADDAPGDDDDGGDPSDTQGGIVVPSGCEIKVEGDHYLAGLLPHTGPWPVGNNWELGMLLATREINAAGGLDGQGTRLGIITCDTAGDKPQGTDLATRVGQTAGVSAIVGSGRSAVYLGDDINDFGVCKAAAATGTVSITPGATNPTIGMIPDDGHCFRTCGHDGIQGAVWAKLVAQAGYTNVHYLSPNDDSYTLGLAQAFVEAVPDPNWIVGGTSYDRQADPNFVKSSLEAARAQGAEVLLLSMFADDAAKFVNQWATMDWGATRPFLIAGDGVATDLFLQQLQQDSLAALDNRIQVTYPGYPNANTRAFETRYRTAYGQNPPTSEFVGSAYDAVYMLAIAMAGSPTVGDKSSIRDGLMRSQVGTRLPPDDWAAIVSTLGTEGQIDYDGVAGNQDFVVDADGGISGDVIQPIGVRSVFSGAFVDATNPCWTPGGPCQAKRP